MPVPGVTARVRPDGPAPTVMADGPPRGTRQGQVQGGGPVGGDVAEAVDGQARREVKDPTDAGRLEGHHERVAAADGEGQAAGEHDPGAARTGGQPGRGADRGEQAGDPGAIEASPSAARRRRRRSR